MLNGIKNVFYEGGRLEFSRRVNAGYQPLVAKVLTVAVERLRDAVAKYHEDIVGLELHRLFIESRMLERPNDEATRSQPLHASGADEQRWVVTSIRVREAAIAREYAVQDGCKP